MIKFSEFFKIFKTWLFYNIMVSTGCRGVEAKYIMANIRRLKVVDLGGYVRVHVDLQRGSKNEFVAYLPKEVYLQLLSFKGKVPHEDTFEKKFRKLGLNRSCTLAPYI